MSRKGVKGGGERNLGHGGDGADAILGGWVRDGVEDQEGMVEDVGGWCEMSTRESRL